MFLRTLTLICTISRMKKRLLIFLFLLFIGISFFVAMLLKTGITEIWLSLKAFKLLHFGVFLFLSLLNFMLYNLRWYLILKKICKKRLSFWQLFFHRMSGFAIGYITPSAQTGGEPLRIMLLEDDGVPNKIAASSVIIDKGLEFAALFVFIALGILVALFDGAMPIEMKNLSFFLLLLIMVVISWFYYSSVKNMGVFSSVLRFFKLNRFKKVKVFEDKIIEIEDEMAYFYKNYLGTFFVLAGISLVITSFLLLEHFLVARFLGVNLTFSQTFLVSTIPYIAYAIPIPGGLGVLEGGHAAIFAALGVSINAFVLVFIIRIRDLFFVVIGLAHASSKGIGMLRKEMNNNGK